MSIRTRAIVLFCAVLSVSGCGRLIYGVELSNLGEQGVIVLQIGDIHAQYVHESYAEIGVSFPIVAGIHPGSQDYTSIKLGRFQGYEDSLPDKVEITWQLADLINCKIVVPNRYNRSGIHREGCDWSPLPDKIFRQTLDMAQIKATPAYKKTGTRNERVSMSRYTLNIEIIFEGETVRMEAQNGATNPWK